MQKKIKPPQKSPALDPALAGSYIYYYIIIYSYIIRGVGSWILKFNLNSGCLANSSRGGQQPASNWKKWKYLSCE